MGPRQAQLAPACRCAAHGEADQGRRTAPKGARIPASWSCLIPTSGVNVAGGALFASSLLIVAGVLLASYFCLTRATQNENKVSRMLSKSLDAFGRLSPTFSTDKRSSR